MKPEKKNNGDVEVLVAEDSATQREQLRALLEEHGYAVVAAANGKEALEAMRRRAPALVVSDIVMPELDGYGLCRAIKSDEALKHIPVMLVTTLSDPMDVLAGLECGADNFIRKPYEGRYLLSRIEHLLMNVELRRHQKVRIGVEIGLGGRTHFITAERQQILDLLVSIYEQAVRINEDLKSRERELLHSNQVLNGLYRIAEGLNTAVSQQAVGAKALERAMEIPGVQAGWISLRQGETGFRLLAARNLPPALGRPGAMEGECACRRKLLSGELESVTNILECERLGKATGDTRGLRVHASVPLWLGGETLGVMNLAGPNEGLFDEGELKMLYGIGHEVAVALERARLHEHLEQLVEQRTAALTAEIAQRKQAQEALHESEAGLRRAQAMAKLAHVIVAPDGAFERWSETLPVLLGVDAAQAPRSTGESLSMLEPEDRALLRSRVVEAEASKSRVDLEYRLRRPDGEWIHIRQAIEPIAGSEDAQGRMRWFNTLQDVTERKRAEEALHEAGLRYRSVFENVAEGIFLVDAEGRVVAGNPALARMLGYASFEDMAGSVRKVSQDVYVEPGSRGRFRGALEASGAVASFETRWRRKDGDVIWVSLSARMTTGVMGGKIHHIGVAEDITARRHAEEKIRRLNRIYAVLSGINTAIVRIRDRQELFQEACRIAIEHGGFTFAWIGLLDADTRKVSPVAKAGRDDGYLERINLSADPAAPGNCELVAQALTHAVPVVCNDIAADERMRTWRAEALKRGYRSVALLPLVVESRPLGVFVIYSPEPDVFDEEEMKLLVEMAGDIAFSLEHIGKEERLNYLAYYDTITGLPNRTLFQDRLEQRALDARSDGSAFSVVMLDLDRFRSVNESLGQAAGDDLLREVAQRLKGVVGDSDILARVGGNAFAVATRRAETAGDTTHVPDQFGSCIRERLFAVHGKELRLGAKIGVALFPADGGDAESLYRNAEAALKEAKRTGLPYRFYESRMNAMVGERLALEGKMRRALENDEFVLHYQPKVSLATGRIVGVEALIRWRDPEADLVPPGKFISVLEETGMILEAGRWAIKRALTDVGKWRAGGAGPVRVSVNISAVQLRYEGFVSDVERAIRGASGEAASLELEITESLVMEDIETNIRKLKAVRELGAIVAIDDFGTGYSSLSYIVRLPVNALKIDRAFVSNMTSSADDTNIVSTIISLAHSMKLTVVAEGVETADQAKLLRLLRCDEIQGYLFSPAVAADEMERMLREGKTLPA